MKLVKEIRNMYQLLPKLEQEIFNEIFHRYDDILSHKQKEIIYNILLWRTTRTGAVFDGTQ